MFKEKEHTLSFCPHENSNKMIYAAILDQEVETNCWD